MSSEAISLWTETSSDPELIAGVRAGDTAAFGLLYERHVDAARKVAAVYTNSASDVDDVVSEAFSRVLRALQRGDGPDLAFRAYLFTIVRRTGMDTIDKGIRTKPREDMSEYEASIGYEAPADEPALEGFEQGLVADAFKSLPERWQAVLWYTEVEKKSPREIAPLLGLSANGVAALSYRAREALRQAYLQQHLNSADTANCLEVNTHLGAFVRGGLSKREHQQVDTHVQTCEKCAALVAELNDVNRGMRAIIAPLILGVLATRILDGGLPVGGAFTNTAQTGAAATGGAGGVGGAGGLGAVGSVGTGVAATTVASVAGPGSSASATVASGGAASVTPGATGSAMGALTSALSNSLTVLLPAIALTAAVVLVMNVASVFTSADEPEPPAVVAGPTTDAPDPEPGPDGDGSIVVPPVDDNDAPDPGDLPWAPELDRGDSQTVPPRVPDAFSHGQQTHTPNPTQSPNPTQDPTPTQQPEPTPTPDPAPQPTRDPEPTPTQDPAPQPTRDPEPTPTQDPAPQPTQDPEPTPTQDPEPTPTTPAPTTPPTGTPKLMVGTSALDYLTISRTAPKVTVDVSNPGDGPAESVTTTVEIPEGLAFATPSGGVGATGIGSSALISAFTSYALTQSVTTVEGWECSFDLSGSVATCEVDEIAAGATTSLSLNLTVLTSGQLGSNAVTTFSVTNEYDSDSYSVRTGLMDYDPQLSPVYVHDGPAAATQVGAPLMGCDFSHNQCANTMNFNGNGAEDRFNNSYWNRGDRQTKPLNEAGGERNSATTTLTHQELPENTTVLYATLKWSSVRGETDVFDGALDTARIKAPSMAEYMDITADAVQHSTGHNGTRHYYQSTANITDLVAQYGVGDWSLADIALPATNNHEGESYYGGFTITIIYEDPALPHSRVALFEGDQWVLPGEPFRFPFSMHSAAKVEVGMVAWEGRRGTLNDLMRICDNQTSMSPCGVGMTPYKARGVGDSGNIADSTARGSAWANTLGVDAKSFVPTTLPGLNQVLWAETSSDTYMIGTLTVTIAYQD